MESVLVLNRVAEANPKTNESQNYLRATILQQPSHLENEQSLCLLAADSQIEREKQQTTARALQQKLLVINNEPRRKFCYLQKFANFRYLNENLRIRPVALASAGAPNPFNIPHSKFLIPDPVPFFNFQFPPECV